MTQYASQDRGSGRISQLAPWSPQPPSPIAPQAQAAITPQDFMQGMAGLQTAMQANTTALAEFQRQHQAAALTQAPQHPAPVPYHYPQAWAQPHPWAQPTSAPPPWQPPQNTFNPAINPTISPNFSPVFHINIDAKSHSQQDNGGGGWWGLVFLALFVIPIGAAMVGGR